MHISLPIRKNHMGRRWIVPSSSVVPRFAIRVIERSLSISYELRTPGLVESCSFIINKNFYFYLRIVELPALL
jgi:hypothetical protein